MRKEALVQDDDLEKESRVTGRSADLETHKVKTIGYRVAPAVLQVPSQGFAIGDGEILLEDLFIVRGVNGPLDDQPFGGLDIPMNERPVRGVGIGEGDGITGSWCRRGCRRRGLRRRGGSGC